MEQARIAGALGTLDAALDRAMVHLMAAHAEVAPFLVALTPEQTLRLSRPPHKLPEAARAIVQAVSTRPALAAAVPDWDGALVVRRLEAVERLAPLLNQASALEALTADSHAAWLDQAYRMTLSMYQAARVLSAHDPTLRTIVAPLADVYAEHKSSGPPKRKD